MATLKYLTGCLGLILLVLVLLFEFRTASAPDSRGPKIRLRCCLYWRCRSHRSRTPPRRLSRWSANGQACQLQLQPARQSTAR